MLNRSNKYKYKIAQFKSDIPKPKRNEVVFIPRDNRVVETPPYIASEQLPSWWKDLPKGPRSIRRCQASYDFVSYGVIIPSWTDFYIRPNPSHTNYEFRSESFADSPNTFNIDIFPESSVSGCPLGSAKGIENSDYIKLVNPWHCRTAPGTSILIMPIVHEFNKQFIVMPGIVNCDYYNQINIVIVPLTKEEIKIPAGQPLAHLIPIRRDADFKKIIFGNESMYKFMAGNGLGVGCIAQQDNSQIYRKKQKEYDEMSKKRRFFTR